jgi:hypothetical protein
VNAELGLQPGRRQRERKQQFSSIPVVKFKTAFEEPFNKHELKSGIEKKASMLQLAPSDRLTLIGNRRYTQIPILKLR